MTVRFERVSRLGYFDHDRLLRDFIDSAYGVETPVPWTILTRIGADMLHATVEDRGASPIRRQAHVANRLRRLLGHDAFEGRVPVNALLSAVAAGRQDLRQQFSGRYAVDTSHVLRWLVLHGINEHRMWHGIEPSLIKALVEPSIASGDRFVPPLAAIVLSERPDLGGRFTKNGKFDPSAFQTWLINSGTSDYKLWWIMPKNQMLKSWEQQASMLEKNWPDFVKNIYLVSDQINRIISDVFEMVDADTKKFCYHKININGACNSIVVGGASEARDDRIDIYSDRVKFCVPTRKAGPRRLLIEHKGFESSSFATFCNGQEIKPSKLADDLIELTVSSARGDLRFDADFVDFVRYDDPRNSSPWSVSAIWAEPE